MLTEPVDNAYVPKSVPVATTLVPYAGVRTTEYVVPVGTLLAWTEIVAGFTKFVDKMMSGTFNEPVGVEGEFVPATEVTEITGFVKKTEVGGPTVAGGNVNVMRWLLQDSMRTRP